MFRDTLFRVLFVYSLVAQTVAVAETDADTSNQARELINKMSSASRELNYDGIFVYRRGSHLDTMRLIHKHDDKGEHERMVSLTGYAREVVRNNDSVTCYFPDNQAIVVEKTHPRQFIAGQLPQPIEKIASYYKFSVAGKDRIAGRPAWVVNIVPKDNFRYGYQLWIDEDTNLLLKSELKDESGRPLEQILFTQIHIVQDIPDQLLVPSITGKGYTWHNSTSTEVPLKTSKYDWSVIEMPAGFAMNDYEKQTVSESTMPVEHMIFTDGLAIVSVFIEKINDKPEYAQGASRVGGINAFATYQQGFQVTAVGEVPQKTVQQMANSVIRLTH